MTRGGMNGTIAFRVRGENPGGFIARMSIPGGELANMISFLNAFELHTH